MAECMGLRFGFEKDDIVPKRKFRWLFQIEGVSALDKPGEAKALPHRRGARPGLTWKEQECQHLNETIHFPFKPEWKPVQLHLYDIQCNMNPVLDWIIKNDQPNARNKKGMYDPESGSWRPLVDAGLKREATILMLGGCGETIERWTLEGCYPQNIEWGELDMDNTDLVTVDLTIRYDRAFLVPGGGGEPNFRPRVPTDPVFA